ncbi:hypothetical protein AALP_AA8G208800 [Arabis alpina]|uniref:RRM domain-containing protein n=1 Tax=Arabis alpina TaxID=50452 RepID=A0A087G8E0_ARAAL|nr:hypothetical protein AALP_AA8G208800 [Arabis alpina]
MALSQSTSFPSLQIPSLKRALVGESQYPITAILSTTKYPLNSSLLTARSKPSSPLRTINCLASAGDLLSEDGTRESTSISSLFVKGLPDSVSEGRLRKVFSEFGQVTNVKIIINERTRQSLGYGYVWFNSKEDAELAVEAMNGKFCDGRFILVKFGQPGLSGLRRSHSDFLFVKK